MVCHRGASLISKTWLTNLLANSLLAERKGGLTSTCQKSSRGHRSPAEFVKRFHQETVQISDLEDEVAYTSFLNGLKSSRFKFSLME